MRQILIIICVLVLMAGCRTSEVQLSLRYRQALEMSAINLKNMLKDCEEGNQQSCEKGLKAASDLIDHIVDASYGRSE